MPQSASKIAIVEDDETIRNLLRMTLASAGFSRVVCSSRGDEGIETVLGRRFGMSELGIIMLTAKSETEDVVAGLDAGADDYVTKPFSRSELTARVNALLRRMDRTSSVCELDGLRVDAAAGSATLDGAVLTLSKTEFSFLSQFAAHPARVYTRRQLSAIAGGTGDGDRTIDVQIAGLRRKLGRWASHLETVRGVGYRVVP